MPASNPAEAGTSCSRVPSIPRFPPTSFITNSTSRWRGCSCVNTACRRRLASSGRDQAIRRGQGRHGLYHETITWAFLLIIAERQARGDHAGRHSPRAIPICWSWKPSILDRYYSKELLASDLARGRS